MGFADEVKAMGNKETFSGTEVFDLPAGKENVDPAGNAIEVPGTTATESKVDPASTAPTKYTIQGKEFTDVNEALAYAREQTAKAQGIQETLDKVGKVQEPAKVEEDQRTFEQEVEELMFTNPQEAIKRIIAKSKQDAMTEITAAYQQEKQAEISARQAEQNAIQLKEFYRGIAEKNPDIADFISITEELVTQKHWEAVKALPLAEAEIFLADKTRELLKIRKEAAAKQTILPDGLAHMAGATGAPTKQAPSATQEKSLDFVSQLMERRKRK